MSCSTTKSSSDIKKSKRFYHNTTALYNGYFNANELVELSLLDIEESREDNYTQLLPLDSYSTNYDATAYAKDMDKAITKVTTTATLHDISQWVDDCYVLMGRAQFVKKDYESAEETFEYFKEEFDNSRYHLGRNKRGTTKKTKAERDKERKEKAKEREEEKKVKEKERKEVSKVREDEKKDKDKARKAEMKARAKAKKKGKSRSADAAGVKWDSKEEETKTAVKKKSEPTEEEIAEAKAKEEQKKEDKETKKQNKKHTPAFYEGVLWLAKTYTERERYSSAEYLYNSLLEDRDVVKSVKKQVPLAKARMYIIKKDYTQAIESLDQAIEIEKDKKNKARYTYIKAQILTQMGQAGEALVEYERAKKYRPGFEMAFNADLNKIILRNTTGTITTDQAQKELSKMAKEEKYAIYQGQIYYAKGQVKLKSGNVAGAIEDFQNSIYYNRDNQPQLTESYYTLAKLFFDAEDYAQSKYYYDSTLMHMPKADYRYDQTDLYAKSLSNIAKNIEIINKQDSLLVLAGYSEEELRDYAITVLDAQGAQAAESSEPNALVGRPSSVRLNASNFFAYNPMSVTRGQDAFKDKWGNRKLEDNWRSRSNSEIGAGSSTSVAAVSYTDQQIDAVLKDVPRGGSQQDLARKKIQEAMFELGRLYREKLQNYEASFAMHKKLYEEHPTFDRKAELLYYLYLSANDLNKQGQAKKYKKDLLDTYPDSEFAKILSNPGYAQELLEKQKAPQNYYDKTFALFELGKHQQVLERAAEVKLLDSNRDLQAKMALLEAMSTGSIKGKKEYIAKLDALIKEYPNTPEEVRAAEMKRFLQGDETAFNALIFDEDANAFSKDFDMLHYGLVAVFKASGKVLNEMKIDINKFHKQYFSLDQLTIQSLPLDQENEVQLILIRSFENKGKAMAYYDVIDKKDKEYITKKGYSFEFFVVNQNNYREIVKNRSINEYRLFFEENYK